MMMMLKTRISGLLAAVLLVIVTVTSGLAVRCGMSVHCDLCPSETTWISAGTECPEMLPAAPALTAGEIPLENRLLPLPALAGLTPALLSASSLSDFGLSTAPDFGARRYPGSPGPLLVLRI